MTRFKLTLEYDGSGLVGWQRQESGPSVQAALEDAVLAFSGETVTAVAAGRTDAGVHALGQVAHLDLFKEITAFRLGEAINAHLRHSGIAVLGVERVSEDFHARFSATGRAYLYRIINRRAPLTIDVGRAWQVGRALDETRMQCAARRLIGQHDFSSFRASGCQATSPVKTLDRLDVERAGETLHVRAEARSFLYRQVRNMVGSLVWVGVGRWSPEDLSRALEACDRRAGGPAAPAEGLYLTAVRYD